MAYTDANWGGCPNTQRSTYGYCVYLGDKLISCRLSDNPPYPTVRVQRPSIVKLPTLYQNRVCFTTFYLNFISWLKKKPLFIAIMWEWFIWSVTRSNINARNILRWIFILFERKVERGHVRVLHVVFFSDRWYFYTKFQLLILFDDFRDNLCVHLPPTVMKECIKLFIY